MAYRIEANCVGCTICAQKCPTGGISGQAKRPHVIEPVLCIDCGVCASYCPVEECIFDSRGLAAPKIKPGQRPIAVVDPDLCSGCGACVDICRCGCLVMTPASEGTFFSVAAVANAKDCTGCKECERVCSDKRAILVLWPDGACCESLGEVPTEYIAIRKAGAPVGR